MNPDEQAQHVAVLAQMKERRAATLLAVTESRMNALAEEVEINTSKKDKRIQLLDDVTRSQKQLEDQIQDVHQRQELERQKLSEKLNIAELELENSIARVLKQTSQHKDPTFLKEMIAAEEKQVQILLALKTDEYKNLRKADILRAMENQLEQEIASHNQKPNVTRKDSTFSASGLDLDIDRILMDRRKDRTQLVSDLLTTESLQRCAFAFLLSRRDQRSRQLKRDISLVIDQLNQLSSLELHKKAQKVNMNMAIMDETRVELAMLLSSLIRQQEQRRQDLTSLLIEMEEQRQNQVSDYWLVQYQRLMDTLPCLDKPETPSAPSMETNTKADWTLSATAVSTAPPLEDVDDDQPCAPPATDVFLEATCVICLDASSSIIFLSCGHMCCCSSCSESLQQCPMCRLPISQKFNAKT